MHASLFRTLVPAALALASAVALVVVLAGCGALRREPGPGEAAPVVTTFAHEGARWLDVRLQPGADGTELSGRFRAPAALHPARRIVLVQGHDANGALVFETRVAARLEPAHARRTFGRVATFRVPLPAAAGVTEVRVSVPADRVEPGVESR